jgi:mRNA interferase RelE/StbE
MPDCYKIKLRELGYRLVYRVNRDAVVIVVLTVGKRERSEVYEIARKRFNVRPA